MTSNKISRRLSIAPMMDRTDRHFRYFLRLITKHTLLYTEMITTGAILHGDPEQFLNYSQKEHPLALQLGGSNPDKLARCSKIAADCGYDEVNLNVGCPSNRVQSARFGACLMAAPELVADCVSAMNKQNQIPITVKTRIGIDECDSYEELSSFIEHVSNAGCQTFIIHARKAWLNGLSPKENREIPPLQYETVYQLKKDYPQLEIIINGGFTSLQQITEQYNHVDGVMIGRVVYQNPYLLAKVDQLIFQDDYPVKSRHGILEEFMEYVDHNLAQGVYLSHMARHILGLYQGQAGARLFRRTISEKAYQPSAGLDVLREAACQVLIS